MGKLGNGEELMYMVVDATTGQESWTDLQDARKRNTDPTIAEHIGGYVLGPIGSAREILPIETEILNTPPEATNQAG